MATVVEEEVGIVARDAGNGVVVVEVIELVGLEGAGEMTEVEALEWVARRGSTLLPNMMFDVVSAKDDPGAGKASDEREIGGEEETFDEDGVEAVVAQELGERVGEVVAEITRDIVGGAGEESGGGVEGVYVEVNIDGLEMCFLAVVLGKGVGVDGVFVGGNGEDEEVGVEGEKGLGERVHSNSAAVNGREGRLNAEL